MVYLNESQEEKDARHFFEKILELTVERVLSSTKETADYIVDGEDPGYVVEVKSRLADKKERKELLLIGHATTEEPWTHRWAVDVARKARKQMRNLDPIEK